MGAQQCQVLTHRIPSTGGQGGVEAGEVALCLRGPDPSFVTCLPWTLGNLLHLSFRSQGKQG